jgi:hypothetical protein
VQIVFILDEFTMNVLFVIVLQLSCILMADFQEHLSVGSQEMKDENYFNPEEMAKPIVVVPDDGKFYSMVIEIMVFNVNFLKL